MEMDVAASRLKKILALMATESRAILSYGTKDDEEGTRQSIDNLRGLHAKLQTIDNTVRRRLEQLPDKIKASIHQDLTDIKRAEKFIFEWNNRYKYLIPFNTLVQTSAGRHRILDYILPLKWNFQGDIFVIKREVDLCFIPELIGRGQARILAIGIDTESNSIFHHKAIFAKNSNDIKKYLTTMTSPRADRLCTLRYDDTDIETDDELWDETKHAFTLLLTNKLTVEAFGSVWLTQGLQNMKSIANGINMDAIKSQLKGLPVVIVSPGPSLDKNIHLLHKLKGHAIIMAAAQCAKALHKIALIPDFIVIADPGNLVYFLEGVDISEVGALIAGVSCHPGFFNKPFKNIISFNANASVDRWITNVFNDTIPLASAGSVSIDCFLLAKYLESSAIIMVGLDLALSGGSTYSNESANSKSIAIIDEARKTIQYTNVDSNMEQVYIDKGLSSKDTVEKLYTLPGYYGGKVITRPNYYLFYNEFVDLARQEAESSKPTPIINCTEGGAYINGFQHMKLSEAINKYRSDVQVKVNEKICLAKNLMDSSLRIKKYEYFMNINISRLKSVIKLINECRTISKQLPASEETLNKLTRIEKKLISKVKQMPFLSLPNFSVVQQALEISSDAENIKDSNGVAQYLYDALEGTCIKVLNAMTINKKLQNIE